MMASFKKRMIKVIVCYAIFIFIGQLMSLFPQSALPIFYDLRMFFMIFGPIYFMLILRIIHTFQNQKKEQGRTLLFTLLSFLFMHHSDHDLTETVLINKGLRQIHNGKTSPKANHFLMFSYRYVSMS